MFDEVFSESTETLATEIANLKTIIGRFSDFSKMPRPELERIDAKDAAERVRALYESAAGRDAAIHFAVEVADAPMPLDADAVAARITDEVSRETDSTLTTLPRPAEP